MADLLREFRRSSFCNVGTCVEVKAAAGEDILVRDGKDRLGPALRFTREEWAAFVSGVKAGEFDVE